jgi:hypothetical protein
MNRVVALAVTAVVALAAAVNPASGVPPERSPLQPPPPATFPAGAICPFELSIETIVNNQVMTTFFDRNGNVTRQLFTGNFVVRLTNEQTDASIELNVSGPGTLEANPDGTLLGEAKGLLLLLLFPTDPGGPGAFVYSGRTDFLIGATGTVTVIRAEGKVRDICAALQPAD